MKILSYCLLFASLFVGSCNGGTVLNSQQPPVTPAKEVQSQSNDALLGVRIIYEQSGGIAGVSNRWTARGDGSYVSAEGLERSIDKERLLELLKELEQLGYFEMEAVIDPFSACADCFTYNLTISYDGKANSLSWRDADPDLPPGVHKVHELVRDFLILDPPILDQ